MSRPVGPLAGVLGDVMAGLTSGLVTLVYSISFAALIFSGKLSAYFPQGVGIALIGATVAAILVAWRSSFPFSLAGPDANSAIILALGASSIAASLDLAGLPDSIFPTTWAGIAISTSLTGVFLYLLGHFRWGRLARYIPYPVIGGFLAGTGWLITRSSFKVMTGIPLGWEQFREFFSPATMALWGSGVAMAVVIQVVQTRFKHFLALPGLLFACVAIGNLAWLAFEHLGWKGNHDDWFFQPFSAGQMWQAWNLDTFTHIDWPTLGHQSGSLLALMAIVMLTILLNSTGLELATSRDIDLDQELRANGVANLLNGCVGGMIGYQSINRSLLNQQAGARSRGAGMLAGVLCGVVLLAGSSFLRFLPKPVLGGLLLSIGANLLIRWIVKARSQFSRSDYLLILLILVIIGTLGFLQGVGAGILIACFLFILSYGRTSSIKHTLSGRSHASNVSRSPAQQAFLDEQGDALIVLVLQGFIFFGSANELLEGIRKRLHRAGPGKLRFCLFDFRLVTGIDSSAALSFTKLEQLAAKEDLKLVFTHLHDDIQTQFLRGGLRTDNGGGIRCFSDLDHGVEWCEDRILEKGGLLENPTDLLEARLEGLLADSTMAEGLRRYWTPMKLAQGETLFKEGEASDTLYFVESGRVSVVIELPDGKILRRGTCTAGSILGEMGFYSGARRSASVVADQASQLQVLSRGAFERIEAEAPQLASSFSRGIVNLVAERLRRSEENLRLLLQ